jgi:rhamnosyltransferase subunit B
MISTHPDVWHPSKGPLLLAEQGMPLVLRPLYNILRAFDPAQTVIVGSSAAIAARILHEQYGTPFISIYQQPAYWFSEHETPILSGIPWLHKAPRPIKRFMLHRITQYMNKLVGSQINDFRIELGLPPLVDYSPWLNSPQRIIGLFPTWFAPHQPDWSPQTRPTGFTLYDGGDNTPFSEELQDFLNAGSRPIVFTLASAVREGKQFFAESVEVCRLLNRRGILVTLYPELLPPKLPETIYHSGYVSFSALFPHAAALVYSGGIGAMALAIKAGIPHLVVPLSHDQPDNAARIERLGLGCSLPFKKYRAALAARKLQALLDSTAIKARCREYAAKINSEEAVRITCDLIEELIP